MLLEVLLGALLSVFFVLEIPSVRFLAVHDFFWPSDCYYWTITDTHLVLHLALPLANHLDIWVGLESGVGAGAGAGHELELGLGLKLERFNGTCKKQSLMTDQ